MGKNQSASNLTNIIKQDASGNITFVSGSTTLMSVSSSGAITTTGNVAGTASYASNAELLDGLDSTVFTLTSSFAAQTASFTAFTASINSFTASQNITNGTFTLTSSFAAQTASFTAFTSSVNTFTASQLVLNGTYATTGSNTFAGIQTVNSNLVVTGSITAQTLVVQTITSSVDFVTGSTRFGSLLDNSHIFTGSMSVSGGLVVTTTAPELTVNATGVTLGNVLTDVHNITGSLGVTGSINATATTHSFFGRVGINTLASNIDALWVSGSIGFSIGDGGLTFADRSGNDLRIYTPSGATRFVDATGLSTFLTIQSSNGNVGIGTADPSYRLHVSGAFSSNPGLYVYGTTYGMVGVDRGGAAASAGVNYYTTGSQRWFTGIYENTNNFGFYNALSASFPMVITTGNNVGIGTTSPGYKLDISGSQALLRIQSTSATFGSPSINLLQGAIDTVISATNNGLEIGTWTANDIIFKTTQVERARISTNGLKFQNGPSYLNYYDEGTWTPIFTFDSGSPYTGATLRYIRIGKLLFLHGQTGLDTSGRSGSITVTNLPFTLETGNGQNSNDCYLAIWGLNDNCYSYGYPSYSLASTSLVLFVHGGPSLGSARYFPLAVANCNLSTIYVSFMNTFVCA